MEASMAIIPESLPHLRFEITEAARILRISRAAQRCMSVFAAA
jgi:hypothetical protein